MTIVKICGITNLEDAQLAARFGADALGFNFFEGSPRYIKPSDARKIIENLPKSLSKVGVFVNETVDQIIQISSRTKLDTIQLHGDETPEFVREVKAKTGLEIIKAFRVTEDFSPEHVLVYEADAVLLDAYSPNQYGGTGDSFDWNVAKEVNDIVPRFYLAGGLSDKNVDFLIRKVSPFAVDACSLLETNKGKKDRVNTINFINQVRNSDWNRKTSSKDGYKPSNIFEILSLIQLRPAMYLGPASISRLDSFIVGLRFGFDLFGLAEDRFDWKNYPSFEFHEFVKDHYGWYESTAGAINIILSECDNDEERALDVFFALLEEFKVLNVSK